jgi:hypothetical protein
MKKAVPPKVQSSLHQNSGALDLLLEKKPNGWRPFRVAKQGVDPVVPCLLPFGFRRNLQSAEPWIRLRPIPSSRR